MDSKSIGSGTVLIGDRDYPYEAGNVIDANIAAHNRPADDPLVQMLGYPARRMNHDRDVYPQTDTYTFRQFPGLVIEFGGYNDIILTDPYTMDTLWVGDAFKGDDVTTWDAIRAAIAVAESVGFLGGRDA